MLWRLRALVRGTFLGISALLRELLLLIGLRRVPVAFYRWGLLIWPRKRSALLRGLAAVYERTGELEKAEDHLVAVVALEPDNPISHWELGAVYEKGGKRNLAREKYEKALNIGTDLSDDFRAELQKRIASLTSQG